jgi:hypothetical protein
MSIRCFIIILNLTFVTSKFKIGDEEKSFICLFGQYMPIAKW